MTWIMIGVIGGSLVVSGHGTKEACEGRAAILREQKVAAKCVEAPSNLGGGGNIIFRPSSGTTTDRLLEYRY